MSDPFGFSVAGGMRVVAPICTKSEGGPYDNEAFLAGWICAAMEHAIFQQMVSPIALMIDNELVAQLDLLAMAHEYVSTVVVPGPEVSFVLFQLATPELRVEGTT